MYKTQRNYENLNKALFDGVGEFDIPALEPGEYHVDNWISFNYAKTCEEPEQHGIHFFIDDYQFIRLWTNPDNYVDRLKQFQAVCTPGLLHVHRLPQGPANLEPLPEALAGCLLAAGRRERDPDDKLERLQQLRLVL